MQDQDQLGPVARRLAATQRVLCVEDEADLAAFLRAYFRAAGFDAVHVDPDGPDDVVAAVVEHEPDAVLLDLRLRGFSGSEAYRMLRSDDRFRTVPVIMVSAHAAADPGFEAPVGIDAFVAKPFNTNVLAALVRDRLDAAARMAEREPDHELDLLTPDDLDDRLRAAIDSAGSTGGVVFALIRLVSHDAVLAAVGREGHDHVVSSIVRRARSALPEGVAVALTGADELGVVLPTSDLVDGRRAVEAILRQIRGQAELPGGAIAPVELACGMACHPDDAGDPDGLFMAADAALADAVDAAALVRPAL